MANLQVKEGAAPDSKPFCEARYGPRRLSLKWRKMWPQTINLEIKEDVALID